MYLDANASSTLRPEAREAVIKYLNDAEVKNASSIHASGRRARATLSAARREILNFLGAGDELAGRLVFTSGGTESCNLLVSGFLASLPGEVVSTSIEHPAMNEAIRRWGRDNISVGVEDNGIVDVEQFVQAVTPETALVSIMAANNETGAIQPVAEIARRLRDKNIPAPIICDCTQAIGKSELSISELFASGVDAIAFSGHKLGSLSGVGGVVLAESSERCYRFEPLIVGGPQEKRFRAGTENLAGVVSLAAVCQKGSAEFAKERAVMSELRNLLWAQLSDELSEVYCLTPGVAEANGPSLSNTLLVRFAELRGDDLVVALDLKGIAASTGSACSSGRQDVSPVLLAMGLDKSSGREVVRFSLDWDSSEKSIREAAKVIIETVAVMRSGAEQEVQSVAN